MSYFMSLFCSAVCIFEIFFVTLQAKLKNGMLETNRIEFKRQLTRDLDIEKEVVAFLNYREGGNLF